MIKPVEVTVADSDQAWLLLAAKAPSELTTDWFQPEFWLSNNAVTGTSRGRNLTYFCQHQDLSLVLRHYYRGGLISRFNKDRYKFTSIEQSRPYRELELLENLCQQSLAVPKPIAGLVKKTGNHYRADLLIEKIADAADLFSILQNQSLGQTTWHSIGETIAEFHNHGLFHVDLNVHNILIDHRKKNWLIDFDRCELRIADKYWQQSNLSRLQRSLHKEKKKNPNWQWQESQWFWLLQGYQEQIR